ncbi:membrane protein [gut metagenome]|uniref:Membrane protein n=1 Tax=gut metagenome TaxID=749906 RepID=J9FIT0_9ZZZZ
MLLYCSYCAFFLFFGTKVATHATFIKGRFTLCFVGRCLGKKKKMLFFGGGLFCHFIITSRSFL